MSALLGDNVVEKGDNLVWFDGPTMMARLETVDVEAGIDLETFRLPVQMVTRPDLDKGFAGTIASGVVRPATRSSVCRRACRRPSSASSRWMAISQWRLANRAITLTLADEIDVVRRASHRGREPLRARCRRYGRPMTDEAVTAGRRYSCSMRTACRTPRSDDPSSRRHQRTRAAVRRQAAPTTSPGTGGTDNEMLFDRYADNRQTGAFILVDRLTNPAVGAG